MAMMTINVNNRVPTHYCRVCGALWFKGADHWSLVSLHCGKCCDNALMGNQIVALEDPTGPEPGCQDCAKEGRFLCDTHGPEPAIPVVIESLSVAPDRQAAERFVEEELIPAAQGQGVEQRAAELLTTAEKRACDRRRRLVYRDDALHAITAALTEAKQQDVAWTDKEQAAIAEMMAAQELSYPALLRQAVRLYQHDWHRRRDGETCTWSGDAQRAREFYTPPEAKQQDDEDEAPTPTALQIRYAEGFADGIKHEEHRAEVAKQQGPAVALLPCSVCGEEVHAWEDDSAPICLGCHADQVEAHQHEPVAWADGAEVVKRLMDCQPLASIGKGDRLYQILMSAGLPFESIPGELEAALSQAPHSEGA